MRVSQIKLKNFKRFTDLDIKHIPAESKLVLLIGANGSGKSTIMDLFEWISSISKGRWSGIHDDSIYYRKKTEEYIYAEINFHDHQTMEIHEPATISEIVKYSPFAFYCRTAIRQIPKLEYQTSQRVDLDKDSDRPKQSIERDQRLITDIEVIGEKIQFDLYNESGIMVEELRGKYLGRLNSGLRNIFGDTDTAIQLTVFMPSIRGQAPNLRFKKGDSEFHYNLLSNGEKEVFNLLVNLFSRTDIYNNSVYFIDELDLHLDPKLQFNLIKEITENWIPQNSQLWVATHALGFIEYARSIDKASIIDFGNRNFDYSQAIEPSPKNNLEIFEIAVPKEILSQLLKGKRLVICENKNDKFYNLLLLPDTVFAGVNGSSAVFLFIKRDTSYLSLRDRDFISDQEIVHINKKYPNHRILRYYNFENYIFHPDNIEEINPPGFNKDVYIAEILRQKQANLHLIIASLSGAWQRYEEFKTDPELQDRDVKSITDDLASDDFERFYKYFDMKKAFDKSIISRHNLTEDQLVKTNWFKEKISEILSA